jgi:hypothetical protein
VDRERLLAIEGRSRKVQIRLAEELGVADYPCPAGGCLLTERDFAARLRDLFRHKPGYDLADVRLLRLGRHFRLRPGLKVVVGRDQTENEVLERRSAGETLLVPADFRGPSALLREPAEEEDLRRIGTFLLRYGHAAEGVVTVSQEGEAREIRVSGPASDEDLDTLRIGAETSWSCRP